MIRCRILVDCEAVGPQKVSWWYWIKKCPLCLDYPLVSIYKPNTLSYYHNKYISNICMLIPINAKCVIVWLKMV